jgi:Zn-dependent M16 (insulinase) family peptidase
MLRFLIPILLAVSAAAQPRQFTYGELTEGRTISGFRAAAVYLDDSGRAIGARFRHLPSGFTLDLLQIQSVPQAFIWVTTYPTSNMGEPHTQEHLLLGKGNKGRALGSQQRMSLVDSSAFTSQWRTCYHLYTSAGPEVFLQSFQYTMDALLHPDYSDEEVHREVRNFGISANPKDGSLHLEEKGSVYNEMVTSMDSPGFRLFHGIGVALYGPEHPLSFSAGGLPEALRVIQPADIKRFHDRHYFLANMGAIVSLPKEVTPPEALDRLDKVLLAVEPVAPKIPVVTEAELPAPRPAPAGRIDYVEYPFRNDQQPGTVALLWPAERKLPLRDNLTLSLFLHNVAGDPTTNLYRRLIDSKTREVDFGARSVSGYVSDDQGNPVYVMFGDVPVAHMNDQDLGSLRGKVVDELARIAAYPDGSAELTQFNRRLASRIVQERRALAKMVNSPPGFGFRNARSTWMETLYELNQEPGFRKSLTYKDDLDAIEKLISGNRNIWRENLARWKITGVTPYIEAAKPSVALVRQEAQEREARAAAEATRLKEKYGAPDEQQAIRRYKADYDGATAAIEEAGRKLTPPKFADHPPMTLDDPLEFKSAKLAQDVPLVTSTFDSMTSATTGLALRLDVVPEDRLIYLSLLPRLLTDVGVIENGKPVSYQEMVERLRNEILSLSAEFVANTTTDRYELTMHGAGNNAAEAKRAIGWMKLALFHPDWRPENLSRIRDVVGQSLASLRRTMQGPEERWVRDPETAWRKQDQPLLLATSSFLTRAHNAQRLHWMLMDGGTPAVSDFLTMLGRASGSRAERTAALSSIHGGQYAGMAKLSPREHEIAVEAARDLELTLPDIPDSSLAADWTYLCGQMARDLRQGPARTLELLDEVRRSILVTGGARMFLVGSGATQAELDAGIRDLVSSLDNGPAKKAVYGKTRRIDQRLRGREPEAVRPVFAGLLNANSQGGVFLNSAALTSYRDTSREKLLDYLAANLYSGGGAHSIFMKTWAAGLAYSNGLNANPATGRTGYYAERTPELPQTLKFVIEELRKAKPDPSLTEYAIAGAFGSRAASAYESRGMAIAADLADGVTPEVVTRFRRAILDLRQDPNLSDELFRRMIPVYARTLPGMGPNAKDVPGAAYLVIGPEKQLSAYEEYLKNVEGPETRVWRLYPRDFWMTEE